MIFNETFLQVFRKITFLSGKCGCVCVFVWVVGLVCDKRGVLNHFWPMSTCMWNFYLPVCQFPKTKVEQQQKQDRILSTAINAICRAITLMASTCQICPSKLVPRNGGALTTRTFWPIGLCMDLSARVDFWGQVMWVSILSNVGH